MSGIYFCRLCFCLFYSVSSLLYIHSDHLSCFVYPPSFLILPSSPLPPPALGAAGGGAGDDESFWSRSLEIGARRVLVTGDLHGGTVLKLL